MRSRRVPVFKLGSRGPGGDARSSRLCSQAFASVRNRSQSSAIESQSSRNAELSSCLRFALQKSQQSQGSGGRGRETQNCRHFWTRLASSRLKNVNGHRDQGGSWSRNPELSSLLDSCWVFASQKCQQSREKNRCINLMEIRKLPPASFRGPSAKPPQRLLVGFPTPCFRGALPRTFSSKVLPGSSAKGISSLLGSFRCYIRPKPGRTLNANQFKRESWGWH